MRTAANSMNDEDSEDFPAMNLGHVQQLLPVPAHRRRRHPLGVVVEPAHSTPFARQGVIRFDPELRAIGAREVSRETTAQQSRRIEKTGQLLGLTRLLDFISRPEVDVDVELRFTGLPSPCFGVHGLTLLVVMIRHLLPPTRQTLPMPQALATVIEQWWMLIHLCALLLGVLACYLTASNSAHIGSQITWYSLVLEAFTNPVRSLMTILTEIRVAPLRTMVVSLHFPLLVLAVFEERGLWPLLCFIFGSHLRIEDMKRKRKEAVVEIADVLRDLRESINEELGVGVQRRKSLQDVFLEMDEDGSGTIDRMEFRRAMRRLHIPVGDREVDIVYLVYDPDKNGLDYHEFLELISFDGSEAKNETGGIDRSYGNNRGGQGGNAASMRRRDVSDAGVTANATVFGGLRAAGIGIDGGPLPRL